VVETPAEAVGIISANTGLRELKHQQTLTAKETLEVTVEL